MTPELPPIPELDYQLVMGALEGYAAPRKALHDLPARGKLTRVKKGVYVQSGRGIPLYSREVLANMIYGPSYLSYESALSEHGLIPERVEALTSATTGKTRIFTTPLGTFTYVHQNTAYYSLGFARRPVDETRGYLLADPEKALADRVLRERGRFSIRSMGEFLFENLRIEPDDFRNLDEALLELLAGRCRKRSLQVLNRLRRKIA